MSRVIRCAYCNAPNDAHERYAGEVPSPGDWSICWSCREVSVYTPIGVRKMTPEEEAERDKDPEFLFMRAAMMEARNPMQAVAMIRGEYK